MNTTWKLGAGWVAIASAPILASAQGPGNGDSRPIVLVSAGQAAQGTISSGQVVPEDVAREDVIREIDDPHTGDRWLLMRNSMHPGGPGRLVLVSKTESRPRQDGGGTSSGAASRTAAAENSPAPASPMIRAGDKLIVEEDSAKVDVRLEAVAMGAARAGSQFDVRLVIGGRVVRAIALGPGRAGFATESMPAR